MDGGSERGERAGAIQGLYLQRRSLCRVDGTDLGTAMCVGRCSGGDCPGGRGTLSLGCWTGPSWRCREILKMMAGAKVLTGGRCGLERGGPAAVDAGVLEELG